MYGSVKTAFSSFTNTFEGRIHWMYADVKGLVTTGVGNLIEPVSVAAALPFQHANGVAATAAEITAAWQDIKNNGLTLGAAGANACATRNDLRLTDAAIDNLVSSKLASNEATFLRSFPDFESWPADAQLAGMSMSWALGPAFAPSWPKLTAALKAKDWKTAAANCSISTTGNAGVAPRNVADQALFTNAAAVAAGTADPSVLYYPGTVPATAATGSSQTRTSQTGTSPTGSSQAGSSGASQSGASTQPSDGTATDPTAGTDSTSEEPGSGEDSPSEETNPSSPDTSAGDSTESDADGTNNSTPDSPGDDPSSDDTADSSNTDSTDSDSSDTDSSGDDTSNTESSGDDGSNSDSSGDDTSDTDSSGDDGSGAPGDDSSGSGSSDDDGGS